MHKTRIDIPEKLRRKLVSTLSERLADGIDMALQTKQAHWNVKGPNFIGLHELFDKVAEETDEYVDDIAERGAVAALEYGARFDGVRPDTVRVPVAELDAALAKLDPAVRAALEVAIERTRAVHADQRRTDTTTVLAPGATVTERWIPVERVACTCPAAPLSTRPVW